MKVGLALGSGSARGWAHIGVIRELAAQGVNPDVVAGSSVGAIVGAIHGLGGLDGFERWVRALGRRGIIGQLDVGFSGGFFEGRKLVQTFRSHFGDPTFDDMNLDFAAVATDLETGREVWLRSGRVADAVRASMSLPGVFSPVRRDGRWLVDGGLVNPVPVSVCRALGADVVIAVSLNGDIVGRHFRSSATVVRERDPAWFDRIVAGIRERASRLGMPRSGRGDIGSPGLLQVVTGSINIMQDRITRSRMAGDPPDLVLSPRLSRIGLLEFDRGAEAIEEGVLTVQRLAPAIRALLA